MMKRLALATLAVALASPALASMPLSHYVEFGFNDDSEKAWTLVSCIELSKLALERLYSGPIKHAGQPDVPPIAETAEEIEAMGDHYRASPVFEGYSEIPEPMWFGPLEAEYLIRDYPVCMEQFRSGAW